MTDQTSLVGAVLNRRFRLTRLIGTGGMGAVYAAESVAPLSSGSGKYPVEAKQFAIKLLRPEFAGDADVLARFLEEGRTCQHLIHPNILRVYDSEQAEDGTPFIVMELLAGVPLSAYTANGGRVPVSQAITILQGILAGLAAAHAQGVVHRDLKPENVFLAREANGQFQIKVLDFGIAKVIDAAGGMGARTKTGQLLGTPAYMSPEQVKSAKDVDSRSDLWSAAVMTWEMLTGRVAFPAPTEYARLSAVLHTNPDPLDKVEPSLAPIAPLIARGMQKDPAQRYATALEMARAVAAVSGAFAAPSTERAVVENASTQPHGGTGTAEMPSRLAVTPLSRLPAVPPLFAPTSGISPGASSERATPAAPPVTGAAVPIDAMGRAPGGTLASGHVNLNTPLPPPVRVVEVPQGATMPSHDLPVLDAVAEGKSRIGRGVAAWVVVALVLAALAAGFVLGFAVSRL
jgi:serine/threonine-protein kinase